MNKIRRMEEPNKQKLKKNATVNGTAHPLMVLFFLNNPIRLCLPPEDAPRWEEKNRAMDFIFNHFHLPERSPL